LQTPHSSSVWNRRPRPPPIDIYTPQEERRLPQQNAPLHRQPSKGGIRSIFNRNKVDKNVMSPTIEEGEISVLPSRPEAVKEKKKTTPLEALKSPSTPASAATKTSRLNLRSKSTKETPAKPVSKANVKSPSARTPTVWDPPPLFQAYPQSIKHAQLSASTISTDAILRMHNHKRKNSLTEPSATLGEDATKSGEKSKSKHKRQLSGSLSKAEWTQKIFVLVTSGYLLQYAGDGSFDRLPEKIMQLGKDSVAFVSDVIPGKHWVLQVSQSMDTDGTPIPDTRSLLSRLTFRGGADYRRSATSMLLVLDCVEDMESWLGVFRREIELLGGKKHIPDITRQKSTKQTPKLVKQPSHRFLVAKDPDQFPVPASPSAFGMPPNLPWSRSNSLKQGNEDTQYQSEMPQRPSFHQQSATNSLISRDGQSLDELRDNRRFSYMSSGQRTSTQYSSPEPSPIRENSFHKFHEPIRKSSEEAAPISRPNAAAINERRRSMQPIPIATYEQQVPKIQRHSTYGPPAITTNFSVPHSSNRRYSTTKSHIISPTHNYPVITSKSSEPLLRGVRKTPPPAISVARPLSPVLDHSSPLQQLDRPVSSCTESSTPSLHQFTTSIVDIAPRSPIPNLLPIQMNHPTPPVDLPQHTARQIREAGTAHLNFEFPKRPTSLYQGASYDAPPARQTVVTAPVLNKRHSLASPERHSHVPHQATSITPQTTLAAPVVADISKSLLKRPLSFSPASSSTNLRSSSTITSSTFPFPRTATTKLSPPRPKRHHPQVSELPDLPTFTGSRTRTSYTQRFQGVDSTSAGGVMGEEISGLATAAGNGVKSMAVGNRRSMPLLVGGPPPAPPPDCALPALPMSGKRLSVKA